MRLLLLAAFSLILPLPASARTWVVRVDGTGDAPTIKAAIESTYGPDCGSGGKGACHITKMNEDDYKTYFWYKSIGLVVFFKEDGNNVQSFLYVIPNSSGSGGSEAGTKDEGKAPKPGKTSSKVDSD